MHYLYVAMSSFETNLKVIWGISFKLYNVSVTIHLIKIIDCYVLFDTNNFDTNRIRIQTNCCTSFSPFSLMYFFLVFLFF